MPSPFPGMDPYLEAPDIWPDFHDALASEIRGELNRVLPGAYYARLEMRPEIGIVGDERPRRIVPDVAIARPRGPAQSSTAVGQALLDRPRAEVSPSILLRLPNEPVQHHFVEIRDAAHGHDLVTLIEIASPANKSPGLDRQAYEAKQRQILNSKTSLVELDFLRGGEPLIGCPRAVEVATRSEPRPDYLVAVNRAWQRGAELTYELFPILLEEPLPCIHVPLREGEAEVRLDLQFVFQQTYDSGPYARGAVDYSVPPDPPLRSERSEWLAQCLDGTRP